MEDHFTNKYAIEIESQHRWTAYKIISTPSGYAEMLRALNASVDGINHRSESDPQFRLTPKTLWGDYATLARRRTSFVYLSFEIDNNLDDYHRPRFMQGRILDLIFVGLTALILILAGIGLVSIMRFIF